MIAAAATTIAPASLRDVCVAPFALVRVAAVAAEQLAAVTPATLAPLVARGEAAAGEMDRLGPAVEATLFAAVPRCERGLRRHLLAVLRDVHNRRVPRAADAAALAPLGASLGAHVVAWLAAAARLDEAHTTAATACSHSVDGELRRALESLIADDAFRRPLAVASPDLSNRLTARAALERGRPRSSKLERALLTFAARAAAKTSPFSTFLHVGAVRFDAGATASTLALADSARSSRAYVNPGIVVALAESLASALPPEEMLVLNPSLRWVDGVTVAFSRSFGLALGGRLWRTAAPVRLRLHPRVAERLRALGATFPYAALVAALETCVPDGTAAAERLVAAQLVRPLRLVEHGGGAAAFLEGCAKRNSAAVAAQLERVSQLAQLAAALPEADRRGRVALVERAARIGAEACATATTVPAGLAPIFEDGHWQAPGAHLGGAALARVVELGRVLQPLVVERADHRLLVDAFVSRFGAGGRCGDIAAFLGEVAGKSAAPAGDGLPRPPVAEALPATALVQLATSDGEELLVLNQLYVGCGMLSARYAAGDPELRGALAAWLRGIAGGRRLLDVTLCSDCNPLQRHPLLTDLRLAWPGEPPGAGAVALDALVLGHDAASDRLRLLDAAGVPLEPVWLGSIKLSARAGIAYWLTVLAQPFEVRPLSDGLVRPPTGTHELATLPRVQQGRVVLARARWWMSAERLRRRWLGKSGAARLFDVAADAQALGLPRQLFVRAPFDERPGADVDARKPLWIDRYNPFCLELVEALVAQQEWLCFTEALPALGDSFVTVDGRSHTAELLVEFTL